MYKGFFEDFEYVMGLFFKPFEGCCEKDDDRDEDEEKECGMGCDCMPCCKEGDEDAGDEEEDKDKDSPGGFLGPGPLTDVLKCMFDASDTDYDYED